MTARKNFMFVSSIFKETNKAAFINSDLRKIALLILSSNLKILNFYDNLPNFKHISIVNIIKYPVSKNRTRPRS